MAVAEEFKKQYHERYLKAKQKGVKFFPDVIYKDLLVSFALFIVLVMLATFVGVANEPKADPSDATYIPRPEWYFLFLFEMLKFFPGADGSGGHLHHPHHRRAGPVPAAVHRPQPQPLLWQPQDRHRRDGCDRPGYGRADPALGGDSTPAQEETGTVAATLSEQIVAGQELYSVHCVECHGAEGEGGEIKGVEGLEGVIMKPINSQDEMYTRTDETLFNIISYGQPDLGMQPFGKAFGGELGVGDIDAIVAFMRYTWDDRAELPPGGFSGLRRPTARTGRSAVLRSACLLALQALLRLLSPLQRHQGEPELTDGDLRRNDDQRRPCSECHPLRSEQQPVPDGAAPGNRGRRSDAAQPGAEAGVCGMVAALD